MTSRVAKKAEELGLELNEDAFDSLADLSYTEACALLEQVAGKGTTIRNPSAYIAKTIEHGYDPSKGGDSGKGPGGKGGGKRPGGKSGARAEELGLDLDDDALDALAHIPLTEALNLLEDTAGKGGDIRNPSGWIVKACEKISGKGGKGGAPVGKGPSRKGGRSAARADELGLNLDDAALDALAGIPLGEALALVEETASKSVRNPSSYISAACNNINMFGGTKGGGGKKGGGGGGGGIFASKSGLRAQELGIDLEEGALEAISKIPLAEALNLLDDMAAKGTGKGGGIRNPSGYVLAACEKMARGQGPMIVSGKGKGPGGPPPRQAKGGSSFGGPGGRSAEHAAQLGIDLDDEALGALSTIPLRDAFGLLDDMAGKGSGKIRNPSGYVLGAVNKMSASSHVPVEPRRRGGPAQVSIEQRIIDLNRSGIWQGEKIDVEAMMALKRLSDFDAHDLLNNLENLRSSVRNPSGYLGTAVSRMLGETGVGRKRPRAELEDRYDGRRGGGGRGGGVGDRGGPIAAKARRLGIDLDGEALDALEAQAEDDALHMLDQVAEQGDKIKNPSKYIASACARGLEFREDRAPKRGRF